MIQYIKLPERNPSFGQQIGNAIGGGLGRGFSSALEEKQKSAKNKKTAESLGIPPEVFDLPESAQDAFFKQHYASDDPSKQARADYYSAKTKDLENKSAEERDLFETSKSPQGIYKEKQEGLPKWATMTDAQVAELKIKNPKAGKAIEELRNPKKEGGITAQSVPPKTAKKIKKILADNPKAGSDELRIKMDEAGIEPVYSNPYTENRRRMEEQAAKSEDEKTNRLRQETLPLRTEIAKKADAAQEGIKHKQELIDLIEKGDINDPTYAAIAENLPLNLGKRLLSNDTVEYKAGLIDEFKDLRNIFPGQVRVKEIELLEQKIADVYLTDDQKKAVLNSRLRALRADVLKADIASELEKTPMSVLEFTSELNKRYSKQSEALFNQILDEHNAIIKDAENKKKIPLNKSDPEDLKIMQQIMKEAKNDPEKALKLGKEKGYIFK